MLHPPLGALTAIETDEVAVWLALSVTARVAVYVPAAV